MESRVSATIAMEIGQLQAENSPLRGTVVIRNPNGLHMRPAMMIVKLAGRYQSAVTIRRQERVANGKSVTNLMSLAAPPGAVLELEVVGEDAHIALPVLAKALAALSSEDLELMMK